MFSVFCIKDQLYADRYAYIPSFWLTVGITFYTSTTLSTGGNPVKKFVKLLPIILLIVTNGHSVSQNVGHWRSNLSLWKHATEVQPNYHRWWWTYAQEIAGPDIRQMLSKEDRLFSIDAMKRANSIEPKAYVYYGIAKHYDELTDYKNAFANYKKALSHHDEKEEARTKNHSFKNQQERYQLECGAGRAAVLSEKYGVAEGHLSWCIKNYPNQMSANCLRRSKTSSPYKDVQQLPPGVWWHAQPGDDGRPGTLCAVPLCTKGCFTYFHAIAKSKQHDFVSARHLFQQAHSLGYNNTDTHLHWVHAEYQMSEWNNVLEISKHFFAHEKKLQPLAPQAREQMLSWVETAKKKLESKKKRKAK